MLDANLVVVAFAIDGILFVLLSSAYGSVGYRVAYDCKAIQCVPFAKNALRQFC